MIVGTAGHIDHVKTTLTRALRGVHLTVRSGEIHAVMGNQKIRENTMTMEDFLDADQSDDLSDEDWDGDQDMDAGYAW